LLLVSNNLNITDKRGIRKSDMNLQGARILIVEDDFLVAMAANQMVQGLGGVVAGTARSVAAAKEKIRQPRLDYVMLDVNLNGHLSLGDCSRTRRTLHSLSFLYGLQPCI